MGCEFGAGGFEGVGAPGADRDRGAGAGKARRDGAANAAAAACDQHPAAGESEDLAHVGVSVIIVVEKKNFSVDVFS